MNTLHPYIYLVFALATLITVVLFFLAARRSKAALIILTGWLLLQMMVSIPGYYQVNTSFPPRFFLLVVPPLLLILLMFLTSWGKKFIDRLDLRLLTLIHSVRIPVELVLFWLLVHGAVPKLMTFEGRNFDIIAGLTAPFMYWLAFKKHGVNKTLLLAWNFICLALLLNIVINAALSAPLPFQQFAFDQPNIAVLYFPFVWLPSCIVPLVLLSHLAAIWQMIKK